MYTQLSSNSRYPQASASRVVGLKACTTTTGSLGTKVLHMMIIDIGIMITFNIHRVQQWTGGKRTFLEAFLKFYLHRVVVTESSYTFQGRWYQWICPAASVRMGKLQLLTRCFLLTDAVAIKTSWMTMTKKYMYNVFANSVFSFPPASSIVK